MQNEILTGDLSRVLIRFDPGRPYSRHFHQKKNFTKKRNLSESLKPRKRFRKARHAALQMPSSQRKQEFSPHHRLIAWKSNVRGHRRNGIFGISPEEEIEEGGIQAASFEEIEEEEFQAEHGNAAEDDGWIQAEEENEEEIG